MAGTLTTAIKSRFAREYGKTDKILLLLIMLLIAIGIIALFSASPAESRDNLGNFYGYFVHQLGFGFIAGGILAVIFYKIPLRKLKGITLPLFIVSLLLTFAVFIPGLSVEGGTTANRWLDLGIISFQPSELLKLSSILYLAALLESKHREIRDMTILWVFLVLLGLVALPLILQPDFSTLGLIVVIFCTIYFLAGASWKNIAILIIIASLVSVPLLFLEEYRRNRLLGVWNPREKTTTITYHLKQAETSIGSGGLLGSGLLDGWQHERPLPEPMTDSIFAVWGDETGFVGASVVVTLFLLLSWRIVWIAQNTRDIFARLTLIGIGVWIFLQSFINMGAMVSVAPLTGIALPYISYGSSSLVTILIASGIALQLSNKK